MSDNAAGGRTGSADRPTVPAYRRIMESIRTRIERGALKPGDRIESERELAVQCGVSLMTARHAIQRLEADGLVTRRVGAGTFVAPPKVLFNRLRSFSEQMAASGRVARSKVVGIHVTEGDADVAARLGLAPGSRLLRIERVRYGDADPFAFETTHLSHDAYPKVARALKGGGSLFDVLQREYGMELGWADEEIDATSVDGRIADVLEVPRNSPVLRIRQLVFATDGSRLTHDVGIYRSDRHTLMIRRFR